MSYTTIKAIWPGIKCEDLKELRNSHGSAPVIWDAMCRKYFNTKPFGFYSCIDKLWPKYKDLSVPFHQRAVLTMTFDMAYVSKNNYSRAAKDIYKFFTDFPINSKYTNHWSVIAELFKSDPDIPAIGFHFTSISEDLWSGEWNEEEEKYNDIDWTESYEVYSELAKYK